MVTGTANAVVASLHGVVMWVVANVHIKATRTVAPMWTVSYPSSLRTGTPFIETLCCSSL